MTEQDPSNQIATIAESIKQARCTVAFTGAGISTESGIPDFRSPGGIWAQSKPVYFQEFLADEEARYEYWRQKSVSHCDFWQAAPNQGHRILAEWEAKGLLRGVITQNIDGLHAAAGSQNILELHGTARRVGCLDCGKQFDADPMVRSFIETNQVPRCDECGGVTKHSTISFGQKLPPDVLQMAIQWSKQADVFLVLGSSLVVEPAASLPRYALDRQACLMIVNRDPTPLDSRASVVVHQSIGDTLQDIDRRLFASVPFNE